MDSYQLKWHSHSNHLNGSVAALLRSERFTDVILCTFDGCQIPAHKFILNSCSIYLSNLFESQRSTFRLGSSMIYVILPAEITAKALKILIEYMYRGETTVSNDVLEVVLKAGDLLKIRGLCRQGEDKNENPADKIVNQKPLEVINKTQQATKKADETPKPKISVKTDEKLLKTFTPLQHINITRQSFINPPKLVFIKKSEGNVPLRPLAPKPITPQTIVVKPDLPILCESKETKEASVQNLPAIEIKTVTNHKKTDKKYSKKLKTDHAKSKAVLENNTTTESLKDLSETPKNDDDATKNSCNIVAIKPEPDWEIDEPLDASSMFHSEIIIKPELDDIVDEMEDIDEIYSPLTCELCFEVFHIPAEWVRHIQTHAEANPPTRKRKTRSASDDTEEATALLRCDLCQKHFPNPAEWVRHIQNTHTERELAMSNNSSPPRRHNRYIYGDQKKTCDHCKKLFPSHASMVIHLRTHTGEKPFVCGLCNKGFNVKSNLLRHLRTLHDTVVQGNVALLQDEALLNQSAGITAELGKSKEPS